MAGGGLLDDPLAHQLLEVAADQGLDLRRSLLGDDDALRPTEVAQPALLLVEAVLARALPSAVAVAAVAGHSVGEYAACVAAGAIDPADAMRLVIERGRAMAAMREGTMSAILGLDAAAVADICTDVTQVGAEVVVANLNAPAQVVISGTLAGVEAAENLARERGSRRVVRLNVSGAFHSPLMAGAAARLAATLDSVEISPARVPIVANVDAAAVTAPEAIRDRLRRQLTAPVRWVDCVAGLAGLGATALLEVGPGAVLSGLARRIAPGVPTLQAGSLDEARAIAVAAQ